MSSEEKNLFNKKEIAVVKALVEAWNLFNELEPANEWDRIEFMNAIHAAQNIVLARPGVRAFNENEMIKELFAELSKSKRGE